MITDEEQIKLVNEIASVIKKHDMSHDDKIHYITVVVSAVVEDRSITLRLRRMGVDR